jgi:nitrite reductase/ring-hydroxylating ferredoxin subunit
MKRPVIAILLLGASSPAAFGFVPKCPHIIRQAHAPHSSSSLSMARRGKGLDVPDGGASGTGGNGGNRLGKPKSIRGSEPSSKGGGYSANWIQTTIPSIKSLPQERDVVRVIETGVPALIDRGTNPNGAVSIVNRDNGRTYCFSSSCSSCKIPLTKATVLGPNDETNGMDDRIQCDFCGATYNLRTGTPVKEEGGKALGFLFSGSKGTPLPVYGLGEQGGKVYINLSS